MNVYMTTISKKSTRALNSATQVCLIPTKLSAGKVVIIYTPPPPYTSTQRGAITHTHSCAFDHISSTQTWNCPPIQTPFDTPSTHLQNIHAPAKHPRPPHRLKCCPHWHSTHAGSHFLFPWACAHSRLLHMFKRNAKLVCVLVCMCVLLRRCTRVYVCTSVHVWVRECALVCMCVLLCMCVYVCVLVRRYVACQCKLLCLCVLLWRCRARASVC